MIAQKLGRKSTVLGTRVAVPVAQGYYAPATIQAVSRDGAGHEFLTVKLDDNKKREFLSSTVIGNGFKTISDIRLKKFQRVFTIHNGRSVSGFVEQHSDGMIIICLPDFDKDVISRHEDEVALIEHRQSPRLNEHNQELDYRKLASVNASPNHGKKGPVSASIEVPGARQSRVRKSSAEPTMDELMAAMVLSSLSSSPVFHNPRSPSIKKESFSHSFGSSGVGSWSQEQQMSPGKNEYHAMHHSAPERNQTVIKHAPSMEHSEASTDDPIEVDAETSGIQDSGYMGGDEITDMEQKTTRHSTPAPFQSGSPHKLSASPQNPTFSVKLEAVKEETGDKDQYQDASFQQPSMFYISSLLAPNLHGFGRPEYVHMQQVNTPPPPLAPPEERPYREMSPYQIPIHHQIANEVMIPSPDDNRIYVGSAPPTFYTIPLVASSSLSSSPLTFTPVSHIRHTPSPLAATNVTNAGMNTTPLQTLKLTSTSHPIPMSSYAVMQDHPYPSQSAQPINIPTAKAFSWHTPTGFSPKPSILQQRQQMHQAASPKMSMPMSPKSLPPGRKVRGDGKKCRKVYGMENRDLWCTACRWKKACQRFPD